jgi:putative transposase
MLFQKKFRIETCRIKEWNYSNDGWYFVTICTNNRICYFGEIDNELMHLSEMGKIVQDYWFEIPKHFPNVKLDEFIVMPNHIHGIIILESGLQSGNSYPNRRDVAVQRLYQGRHHNMSNISPKRGSLPVVIRSYKFISTRTIHEKYPNADFGWQPNYYEHIIRNEKSLENIRRYIRYNHLQWKEDKYFGD